MISCSILVLFCIVKMERAHLGQEVVLVSQTSSSSVCHGRQLVALGYIPLHKGSLGRKEVKCNLTYPQVSQPISGHSKRRSEQSKGERGDSSL